MKICSQCKKVADTTRWQLRVTLDQLTEPKTLFPGVVKEIHICYYCLITLKDKIDIFMGSVT